MTGQRLQFVIWGLVCAGLVGCDSGGGLLPAKGVVTYKGAPLAGATVTFLPPGGETPAIGLTDAKGEFSMNTQGKPGTVPGDHKVGITKYTTEGDTSQLKPEDMMKMQASGTTPKSKSEIPNRYAAPQTSGLTAKVTKDKSQNVFKFELTE